MGTNKNQTLRINFTPLALQLVLLSNRININEPLIFRCGRCCRVDSPLPPRCSHCCGLCARARSQVRPQERQHFSPFHNASGRRDILPKRDTRGHGPSWPRRPKPGLRPSPGLGPSGALARIGPRPNWAWDQAGPCAQAVRHTPVRESIQRPKLKLQNWLISLFS